MANKPRRRPPDTPPLSLADELSSTKPNAEIREALAALALGVVATAYKQERALTGWESEWVIEALMWINWNAGRVSERARTKALDLVAHYKQPRDW